MNFEELGLAPNILKAISRMGFETPTPVQAKVIPRLLENSGDMVALAQTGTGKTAAFGLPILNMLDHENRSPQALVLCPTRELCVQITRDMEAFAACSPRVSILAVYGGTPIYTQLKSLSRGVQIIVATPGRMLDILRRKKADLSGVERVILDEADEMLNMGFQEDLEAILAQVPDTAHTLLFSATMPRHVASIARKYMDKPREITVGQRNAGAENVSHECYVVHQRDRYRALKRIADYYPDMYAIVFCRTRVDTQNVADWLIRDGYNVDSLHGDLSQMQRDRVMDKFRSRGIQILVATDVAARGLDVNDLTHVINYNLPDELGSYTHRSGRTGRAGKSGISVIIVNMREKGRVQRIERMINMRFEYRDVPSGRQICESQLFSLIERMKAVEVDHKQIDQYLPDIYESLKGMEWKEIVKRFVSLEFNSFLDYYRGAEDLSPGEKWTRSHRKEGRKRNSKADMKKGRSRDPQQARKENQRSRAERRPSPHDVRMVINLGRSDGLNPKMLSELIGRESKKSVKAGQIEVKKRCSFFDVPAKDAANLILSSEISDYKGRDVRVAPCDDDRVKRKAFRPPKHRTKSRRIEPGKVKKSAKGDKKRRKNRTRPDAGRGKKSKR